MVKNTSVLHPELWVKRYFRSMFSYTLHRVGGDRNLAEDIVQETFLSALDSQNLYKGLSSEKTWLYAILRHHIMDFYHHKENNYIFSFSSLHTTEDDRRWEEDIKDLSIFLPDTHIEYDDIKNIITSCLEALPPRQSLIFRLKHLKGLSADEICRLCHITKENYWVMMHRAKKHLKKTLSQIIS